MLSLSGMMIAIMTNDGTGLKWKDMEPKKTFEFTIRERFCKGCNICVAFCPKQVLILKNGKVHPEHPDLCIGCRMCEYRCPDFAIEVREAKPEEPKEEAPVIDYTLPPEADHA